MNAPGGTVGLGIGLAAVGVLVLGAAAWWVTKHRELFNPLNEKNLANQAVSSVVQNVTGGAAAGGEDSLGGIFARAREWVSGDDAKIKAMLQGAPAKSPTAASPSALVETYSYLGVGA